MVVMETNASDSKVHIWDSRLAHSVMILTGHSQSVTCVRWGGEGLIYTSSQDRTVKCGETVMCACVCVTLSGRGHWVNTLCLNTDYVLRTGPYESANDKPEGDLHQ
ncbi:notchless protein homolog 1-like [Dysidea avara]|uniref:notchless protein homolog 1-like n=1 Tax=Dysidea avara TaxID=196820 RepID=UPI00332CC2C6